MRRLLARIERVTLDERSEAAREEAQKLLLRRHLARLREKQEKKAAEAGS